MLLAEWGLPLIAMQLGWKLSRWSSASASGWVVTLAFLQRQWPFFCPSAGCYAVKVPASFLNYEGSLFPTQKNHCCATHEDHPPPRHLGKATGTPQLHIWCCLILIFRSIPPYLISSKSLCEVRSSFWCAKPKEDALNEATQINFQQEKQTANQSKSSQAASPPSQPRLWSKTG